jgi:aspartate/methionine/tyrosine aminotransferase
MRIFPGPVDDGSLYAAAWTPEASLADGASRVSVARVELADAGATRVWGRLLQRGVHTVPCRPFYWAEPEQGERYIRVALSRDAEDVERAVEAIRDVVAATVAA